MGGSGQYHPTIEQRELIADFQRPLEELLPVARLHLDKSGETRDRWAGIAELGLFGIALSEEAGGAGLGAAEQALLAERLGRQLASPTLIATAIAVHCDDPAIAAGVAAGEVRVAAGYRGGGKLSLLDPGDAEFVLVLESDEAVLIRIEDVEAAQGLLWASALARADAGAPVARLDGQELRRARLILAATLCGIAGAAAEMAVAYAGMREQFGRPVGAFQAVKHHCANMALAARASLDLATFAAVAFDERRPDAAFQVEAALLLAIEAALGNARLNIQVHGGIGFSDEADPHLLLKRAHALSAVAGGAEAAAARLAALPGPM